MRARSLALLLAVCAASTMVAQTPAVPVVYRGRLLGVFDDQTGEPIVGAEVRNLFNGLSALTTATGTLSLFFVDTTGGMLSIKKVGYEPRMIAVPNSPRDTTGLTIVLTRSAQTLPTVITRAKGSDSVVKYLSGALRGFEERRHQGFGYFVSEADLRKREGARMTEVIVGRVPGVHSQPGRGSATNLVSARSGARGCFVTLYIDGALVYSRKNGGGPPPDFQSMSADEFAGVEFYAGAATMPPQYNATDSGCGVLLLWTRER